MLYHYWRDYMNKQEQYARMLAKRVHEFALARGFTANSIETLEVMIQVYREMYNAPIKPGTRNKRTNAEMQSDLKEHKDANVVDLFAPKSSEQEEKEEKEESFADVIKRNAEKLTRMRKARQKANKGVIRSYRLKR